jgi:two-component system response regulator HupR/HoxA
LTLTEQAVEALAVYDWPGNVRQLRNEIERVVAYATEGAAISPVDFSPEVARPRNRPVEGRPRATHTVGGPVDGEMRDLRNGEGENGQATPGKRIKLKEATATLERELIGESLARNKYNLSRTALDLGLSRRGLRLKLVQLGLSKNGSF